MAENILHFAAIRLRVNGNGNLQPTFYSLDERASQSLATIPMGDGPGFEPLRLGNFISQRAKLRLGTSQIDEVMKVNRIVIYLKEQWTSYPG